MTEFNAGLISKKELLKETGISYGQLYRWKRQNLIPEAWFIKQSAFTGQETFFPRDKMLKRIQMITELKDQYSLEELAGLFSPSTSNQTYNRAQLAGIPGFSQAVIAGFVENLHKETFVFRELAFIYLFSVLQDKEILAGPELEDMITSASAWLPKVKSLAYVVVVCTREMRHFCLLIQQQSAYYLDHKTETAASFDLEELAKDLNLRLNQVLEDR